MKIADMNWMQVEAYLQSDDRAVVPLGSTEQHAYLSLATDSILAERRAQFQGEQHILQHIPPGHQIGVLKNKANPGVRPAHGLTFQDHLTVGRRQQPT